MDIEIWLSLLIAKKNLEPHCVPSLVVGYTNVYLLESINIETSADETLLVYDCTQLDSAFEYDEFLRALGEKDDAPQPIVVFKNWDQEREKYWKYYNTLEKASAKKAFSEWFEKKYSIYTECSGVVSLEIEDDGINYLEYKNGSDNSFTLKGHVYNVSFYELKKLFNVTGAHLFSSNVRYGLKKHSTGELLKTKFREYLCVALYKKILSQYNSTMTAEQRENIEETLGIKTFEGRCDDLSLPENFWFYHNGISIFCFAGNDAFKTPSNKLILPPDKVSVINGAQTLTNFYAEVEYVERNQLVAISKIITLSSPKEMINSVTKGIVVKTVIITGDNKYIRPITYGLNTQIPILEETLLANSDMVDDINKKLDVASKGKIKILKEGEPWVGDGGLSVLDFAKHWLTINNEPGHSKNLGKKKLEELLRRISECLEKKALEVVQKIEILMSVYQWWNETKEQRAEDFLENSSIVEISKYGKNYFATYVLDSISSVEQVDESKLFILYEQFKNDLLATGVKLELDAFKKDDLTKKMLEQKASRQAVPEHQSLTLTPEIKKGLLEVLNEKNQSAYTFYSTISNFLSGHNICIDYFRVICRTNQKCREAFPFPNSTFTELANFDWETSSIPEFEKSLFSKEIIRTYPVFIIEKGAEENGEKRGCVKEVDLINSFSFSDYKEDAKRVYQKTVSAFQEGDESKFPSSSEGISFHIRPKALNSDDTFEFSNGNFITKRTFWANKRTVDTIIGKTLKGK